MDHQLFETWILAKEPLSPEQAKALSTHLTDCLSCRQFSSAWTEVERLLRVIPLLQPTADFTLRWQTRLAMREVEERMRKHRRQSWWTLVISASGALILLIILVYQAVVSGSLPSLLLVAAHQLLALFSLAETLEGILVTLTRTLWSVVPPLYMLVFLSIVALFGGLGIVSSWKILLPLEVRR